MEGTFMKNSFVARTLKSLAPRASLIALVAVTAISATACKGRTALIDHVTFEPSANLETIKVSLVFSNNVQTDLAGGFALKDYGYLFVNPFTTAAPFEVGFNLNTSIVSDQDYVSIQPTEVLPNGAPIGLDHALVEIKSPAPVSSKFDIYGYVDVSKQEWLGTAAIFSFINDKYFPNGLALNQSFLRDAQGIPSIMASVFGPSLSADGTVKRAGGIALFANVKRLISGHQPTVIYANELPVAIGENAAQYQSPKAMMALENSLVRAFNSKQE
jgi:hypothetical protein